MNPIPSPTGLFLGRLIIYAQLWFVADRAATLTQSIIPYIVLGLLYLAIAVVARNRIYKRVLTTECRKVYPYEVVESFSFWELLWCSTAISSRKTMLDCWLIPVVATIVFLICLVFGQDVKAAITFSAVCAPISGFFSFRSPKRPRRYPDDGDGQNALVPANPKTPTLVGRDTNW